MEWKWNGMNEYGMEWKWNGMKKITMEGNGMEWKMEYCDHMYKKV